MNDQPKREKKPKPLVTHTDTVKWVKPGITKKGGDYIRWQMGSLYCKDGETPVYVNIGCFSMRSDVMRLMPNVAEESTKVTVRGELGADCWKGKLGLSIFVDKAWIGGVDDEPADGVDPIAAANKWPTGQENSVSEPGSRSETQKQAPDYTSEDPDIPF